MADIAFGFGAPGAGWKPIAGNWTGGSVTTVGLYDPANSTYYLRDSNTGGTADRHFAFDLAGAGWLPVSGWTPNAWEPAPIIPVLSSAPAIGATAAGALAAGDGLWDSLAPSAGTAVASLTVSPPLAAANSQAVDAIDLSAVAAEQLDPAAGQADPASPATDVTDGMLGVVPGTTLCRT